MSEYFPVCELFMFGGLMWWLFTCTFIVWIAWASGSEGEKWYGGLTILLLYAGVWFCLGDAKLHPATWYNVKLFAVSYIPIGVVYMFLRWVIFVLRQKRGFEALVARFYTEHTGLIAPPEAGKVAAEDKLVFSKWFYEHFGDMQFYVGRRSRYAYGSRDVYPYTINPVAWQFRNMLATWAMWWPFSAFVWIFGDCVEWLWDFIVNNLTRTLTYVATLIWPDATDNFEEIPREDKK